MNIDVFGQNTIYYAIWLDDGFIFNTEIKMEIDVKILQMFYGI